MKIAINTCYGGFGLSAKATMRYNQIKGRECYIFRYDYKLEGANGFILSEPEDMFPLGMFFAFDVPVPPSDKEWSRHDVSVDKSDTNRNDPVLIQVIEELGEVANGSYAKLKVVEIPDDVKWEISEYDGLETVEEQHRSWS